LPTENAKGGGKKHSADTFTLLQESAALLASSQDLPRRLHALTEKMHYHFLPESTCLLLLDEGSQELRCETAVGTRSDELKSLRMKLDESVGAWPAQNGEPFVLEDVRQDSRLSQLHPINTGDPHSVLFVPVCGKEKVLGVFRLAYDPGRRTFSEDEVPALTVLAGYVAIALENERHLQRIHALSITDDCTGLYNARHLSVMLEAEVYRSARFGHEFSLVFMDLDDFKCVNDEHGHLVGSRLLGRIGELIKAHLRLIDSAFRYGGDEFVLLLPQTSKRNTLVVVKRLREALNSQVFFAGERSAIKTTASYGVASFPGDGSNAQGLLLKADRAMYKVKTSGGDDIGLAGEEKPE